MPSNAPRRGGFNWADNRLIQEFGPKIGAYGIAAYHALALHANQRAVNKHGVRQSFPSLGTIAREIGACKRTAIRAIKNLELFGLIRVERGRKSAQGDPTSNLYILVPLEAVLGPVQRTLWDVQNDAPGPPPPDELFAAQSMQNRLPQVPVESGVCAEGVVTHSHHPSDSGTPGVVTHSHQGGDSDDTLTRRIGTTRKEEQDEGGGGAGASTSAAGTASPTPSPPPSPPTIQTTPTTPTTVTMGNPPALRAFDPATEPLDDPDPVGALSLAREWVFHCSIPRNSPLWDDIDVLVPQLRELKKKVPGDRILLNIKSPERDHGETFSKFRTALLRPPSPRLPSAEEKEAQIAAGRARDAQEAKKAAPPGLWRELLAKAGLRKT